MIVHSEDKDKQYKFLVDNRITSDLLSIQDVIDGINNIKLPKGRSFKDTPFCIALSDGIPRVLVGNSTENLLLSSVNTGLNILLNLKDATHLLISQEDELCKKLDEYRKENILLKRKVTKLENKLKSYT